MSKIRMSSLAIGNGCGWHRNICSTIFLPCHLPFISWFLVPTARGVVRENKMPVTEMMRRIVDSEEVGRLPFAVIASAGRRLVVSWTFFFTTGMSMELSKYIDYFNPISVGWM